MMRQRLVAVLPLGLAGMLSLTSFPQTPASPERDARTWIGRYSEVEEFLRTAECDSMETLGPAATSVLKRCVLRPGGPVSRMAWKPLLPGGYRGFRESYKAEIAAYELDKLLKLDMVPPTVERELQGNKGSAVFWVENTVTADDKATPTADERARWEKQLTLMMMFDNLSANKDRNPKNILRDKGWNMILLDHSRSFGSGAEWLHTVPRYDPDFWARIEKLTRKQLDTALGRWLDESEIAAILVRRDKMKAAVSKRVEEIPLPR
jgi:hypothetical protein